MALRTVIEQAVADVAHATGLSFNVDHHEYVGAAAYRVVILNAVTREGDEISFFGGMAHDPDSVRNAVTVDKAVAVIRGDVVPVVAGPMFDPVARNRKAYAVMTHREATEYLAEQNLTWEAPVADLADALTPHVTKLYGYSDDTEGCAAAERAVDAVLWWAL